MFNALQARSLANLSMHLRKACNHPYLLSAEHYATGSETGDREELVGVFTQACG